VHSETESPSCSGAAGSTYGCATSEGSTQFPVWYMASRGMCSMLSRTYAVVNHVIQRRNVFCSNASAYLPEAMSALSSALALQGSLHALMKAHVLDQLPQDDAELGKTCYVLRSCYTGLALLREVMQADLVRCSQCRAADRRHHLSGLKRAFSDMRRVLSVAVAAEQVVLSKVNTMKGSVDTNSLLVKFFRDIPADQLPVTLEWLDDRTEALAWLRKAGLSAAEAAVLADRYSVCNRSMLKWPSSESQPNMLSICEASVGCVPTQRRASNPR